MMSQSRVVIVGAGLAGLCCARELATAGIDVVILEASDDVGGRVRTDEREGFLLDRGFQVLLAAYPECRQQLDYGALKLQEFFPGAAVRLANRFHTVADPWRRPLSGLLGAMAPIGTFGDKLRVARLRRRLLSTDLADVFGQPEQTTLAALEAQGFSPAMIERFFRPFLAGIFLEGDLATSSRMFEFVYKMFSTGPAVLPAAGMQAIPRQLAATLPEGAVRTGCRVDGLEVGKVRLESGEWVEGDAVVVAHAPGTGSELLSDLAPISWCSTACLYFAASEPPVERPILVLDGNGQGPVNNLCVPSQVAPSYAPQGRSLISTSVLGAPAANDYQLEKAVRRQMREWFGDVVVSWELLQIYRVAQALPAQIPPSFELPERSVRLRDRLYVCGDHRHHSSIQGAMVSGRRAALALLRDLQ
jgi:phytoene dehydrogenase-like protein